MFSKLVSADDAICLLDLKGRSELDQAVASGELKPAESSSRSGQFRLAEIILFRLSQAIKHVGVNSDKAARYADAILGQRLLAHDKKVLEWIENETQELFCFIADDQLARIFLRNREDSKEVDIGAIKPVLLPTTKCEINVFRVIRPVVYKARQLLATK